MLFLKLYFELKSRELVAIELKDGIKTVYTYSNVFISKAFVFKDCYASKNSLFFEIGRFCVAVDAFFKSMLYLYRVFWALPFYLKNHLILN